MLPESVNCLGDSSDNPNCCRWAIASDVLGLGVEIGDGFVQPSNAHRVSIS
jgi:hypothetical protein